jgi:saccharopine dehydrogenase (NAD+, L-lysine-forming)
MQYCIIGAGAQGSAVASILARQDQGARVVLADNNRELAERVAAKIGSEALVTATVDASSVDSVVSAAKGCDVILNVVHMDYAQTIRRAALAIGCHCVDSCAEPGFLRDVAFHHVVRDDDAFKAAGISCVTGVGWAPGVSNVLARYAADQLDQVDELYIRLGYESFGIEPDKAAHPWLPHFSPEVALQDYASPALVFTRGKAERQGPFANPEKHDFGGSIGSQVIASHAHDESYTLPLFIGKGIQECDFRYPVNDQAATIVAMGMGNPDRVVTLKDGTQVKPFDVIMALVERPENNFLRETAESIATSRSIDRAIFVEASGRQCGRPLRVRLPYYVEVTTQLRQRLFEMFGTATVWVALPMVVAAKLILRGQVPAGVLPPEALDPMVFLNEMTAMGYPIQFDEELTRAEVLVSGR